MPAILVLGMHRSGTSCLAAVLAAAGARVPGESLRNWDNPRGHHEATALVRLNDDVLAHSGGHWLEAPEQVRWTESQAAARDALLAEDGALLKDPRSLLTRSFWDATTLPVRRIGVVRHPLAVARSLLAWRNMAIDDGLRLWLVHNQTLAEAACPVIDFALHPTAFVDAVATIAGGWGMAVDPARLTAAYRPELVHHDAGTGPTGDPGLLATCTALHVRLCGGTAGAPAARPSAFPWAAVAAVERALAQGNGAAVLTAGREALATADDPAAAAAPVATACLRARRSDLLLELLTGADLAPGLAHLLRAKALLAQGDATGAVDHLSKACADAEPLYEARHLLPTALWQAGRPTEADQAATALLPVALYPFRVQARRAEWAWQAGDPERAFALLEAALASAPAWRQGRLLDRRAAWKAARGDATGAAADLRLAREVDPQWKSPPCSASSA